MDPQSEPSEIDFDLALEIGDFGLGSDAPILLDYREDPDAPRVIRLRWSHEGDTNQCFMMGAIRRWLHWRRGSPEGAGNHWVKMAPDFETFVRELEL